MTRLTTRHIILISTSSLCLVLGFSIYFFFQRHVLFLDFLGISPQGALHIHNGLLNSFVVNHLADAAWCSSLYLLTIVLYDLDHLRFSGKVVIFLLPFGTEAAQGFGWISGTFDWYDMLTYGITLLFFSIIPSLNAFKMKNLKPHLTAIAVSVVFILMVLACASPKYTYKAPPPAPCKHHAALDFSPILVQINLDASYNMKDISGARTSFPEIFMDDLKSVNYSYKLADGVTPNLIFYITVTNDGYNHYGANVTVNGLGEGYLFNFSIPQQYVTPDKLSHDIASRANEFVTRGWHTGNCP
jgi:hypothetical protein